MYCITFMCFFMIYFGFGTSHSCESLNNINVLLFDRHGKKFNQSVNGCITRTEFVNTTVVKSYIYDQIIPKLGRDTIKHMKYLTTVSFNNCAVEEIHPIAFRNVPSLTSMSITFGKLSTIRKGIFDFYSTPKLKQLNLDHNRIETIEDQSFYNISSLKKVQLNNNKLEIFRYEWFENSTFIEILNFSFNKINEIPSRAFSTFKKLQEIYLDYNYIVVIKPDAFKEIRMLTYLGLSHNRLTVLSEQSFPNTVRIINFRIDANYLTFLSQKVLQKLSAVEIYMDYNPWTCPCLDSINYWLYIKNGKSKSFDECSGSHIPVCVVPKIIQDCAEGFDHEAMLRYINIIKAINISTPIPANCVSFQYED